MDLAQKKRFFCIFFEKIHFFTDFCLVFALMNTEIHFLKNGCRKTQEIFLDSEKHFSFANFPSSIAIIFAVKEISTLTNLRGPWSCEYKNQALAAHMAIWQSRPFWFEINRNLNILSHIFSVVFTFHQKTGEQNESAA